MYISDTEKKGSGAAKTALVYLIISVFCALFGAVYELFSHEVYSFYMIYAFGFPLVGGALPYGILSAFNLSKPSSALARNLYHWGIATLTVGSIVRGILDIYGTTNSLSRYYWFVGIFAVAAGTVIGIIGHFFPKKRKSQVI